MVFNLFKKQYIFELDSFLFNNQLSEQQRWYGQITLIYKMRHCVNITSDSIGLQTFYAIKQSAYDIYIAIKFY